MNIKSIDDISSYLINGSNNWNDLGRVSVTHNGDLSLFNYKASVNFDSNWNYFELVSRGLILNNKTGEVVARPFDKFFNWGQDDLYTNSPIDYVMEKMDGSLGILYRDNGTYKVATRGSFDSPQAIWATEKIQEYDLSNLGNDATLLFEIIYPDNRVVVDYKGYEGLVLIGIRSCFTGEYCRLGDIILVSAMTGLDTARVHKFSSVDEIIGTLKHLTVNNEGHVGVFEDGSRFKFKGDRYREAHKFISNLSQKSVAVRMMNGTLDEVKILLPDYLLPTLESHISDINTIVNNRINEVECVFELAPKETKKVFAIWIMKNHKDLSHYLFAMYDGYFNKDLIYKKELL